LGDVRRLERIAQQALAGRGALDLGDDAARPPSDSPFQIAPETAGGGQIFALPAQFGQTQSLAALGDFLGLAGQDFLQDVGRARS
jgi:hypothetical protein